MPSMSKIGISGTIGSGKTEVCNYLRNLGCVVFDCDEENKKILNERSYELLYDDFKECFDDEILNKTKLASLIFNDENAKQKLENIMHPIILDKMLNIESDIMFAEVPLLFEVSWEKYFDQTWLIVSDENIAISRLINRGLNKEDAILRTNSQMPVLEKIKKADVIIYNNGSLDDLYKNIDNNLKDLL